LREKEAPPPADFEKPKKELSYQVCNQASMALDAFRTSLEARLKQEENSNHVRQNEGVCDLTDIIIVTSVFLFTTAPLLFPRFLFT